MDSTISMVDSATDNKEDPKHWKLWVENIKYNFEDAVDNPIKKYSIPNSIKRILPPLDALIVSGGPSVKNNEASKLKMLKDYNNWLFAGDGIYKEMFTRGIYPLVVCSVDGDPIIAKYFDIDGLARGRTVFYMSVTTHPDTINRLRDHATQIRWFMPMIDNPEEEGSYTNIALKKGIPVFYGGGNVGTTMFNIVTWVYPWDRIGMIGFDMSYPSEDYTFENSQYYWHLMDAARDDRELAESKMIEVWNPHINKYITTDPTYFTYAVKFMEFFKELPQSVKDATTNLTETGLLFGEGLKWGNFKEWLGK